MLRCFFFQAEDGIRDYKVTGVQTCALPIYDTNRRVGLQAAAAGQRALSGTRRRTADRDRQRRQDATHQDLSTRPQGSRRQDRKSTRLNSSHLVISYAVFCLKKKKTQKISTSVSTQNRRGAFDFEFVPKRLSGDRCRHVCDSLVVTFVPFVALAGSELGVYWC